MNVTSAVTGAPPAGTAASPAAVAGLDSDALGFAALLLGQLTPAPAPDPTVTTPADGTTSASETEASSPEGTVGLGPAADQPATLVATPPPGVLGGLPPGLATAQRPPVTTAATPVGTTTPVATVHPDQAAVGSAAADDGAPADTAEDAAPDAGTTPTVSAPLMVLPEPVPVPTSPSAPAPAVSTDGTVPPVAGTSASPGVPGTTTIDTTDVDVDPTPTATVSVPAVNADDAAATSDDAGAVPATVTTTAPATPTATAPATTPVPLPVPAPAAPIAAGLAQLPVTRDPVTAQVVPVLARAVSHGEGVQRLVLRLHPADLGEVQVTMTVRDGSVDLTLTAGEKARHHLAQGSGELRQMLELVGASAGQIVLRDPVTGVVPSSASDPSGGPGSPGPGAQDTGRSGTSGSSDGRARPDRGPAGHTGGPHERAPAPTPRHTTSARSLDLTL